jgi:hypothetical protein
MLEVDYPHMESIWPQSQKIFSSELSRVQADQDFVESITHKRAEEFFNFPVSVSADRGA